MEEAGGKALPCIVDIRDETQVRNAVKSAVDKFGGIDIVVNNASAISLTQTEQTDMKRYDLMHNINTRGTFLVTKECLPYLKKSSHPHVLNLSPPLSMNPFWFGQHVAYTMAKYGMSMCVLGHSEEFKPFGIGVNALWPRTAILTAAIEMLTGPESNAWSRKPDIMADAAYEILCRDPKSTSGNFFIDEDLLKTAGVTDFTDYACVKENADKLMPDFFLDDNVEQINKWAAETNAPKYSTTSEAPKKSESSGSGGQIEMLFDKIASMLNEDIVKRTNAVYQFNVKGSEQGIWFCDLKNGTGAVGKGEPQTSPDATLTMDSKNFFAMFTGKLKPASAFMTGKLKISGDLKKAMALEKLMGSLKSKL